MYSSNVKQRKHITFGNHLKNINLTNLFLFEYLSHRRIVIHNYYYVFLVINFTSSIFTTKLYESKLSSTLSRRRTWDKMLYLQSVCPPWLKNVSGKDRRNRYNIPETQRVSIFRICLETWPVQEHDPTFIYTKIGPLLSDGSGNTQNKRGTRVGHILRARSWFKRSL